jgi:hypothetical protein
LQKGLIKKGDMKKGVNWIENAENGGHHNWSSLPKLSNEVPHSEYGPKWVCLQAGVYC